MLCKQTKSLAQELNFAELWKARARESQRNYLCSMLCKQAPSPGIKLIVILIVESLRELPIQHVMRTNKEAGSWIKLRRVVKGQNSRIPKELPLQHVMQTSTESGSGIKLLGVPDRPKRKNSHTNYLSNMLCKQAQRLAQGLNSSRISDRAKLNNRHRNYQSTMLCKQAHSRLRD